MSTGWKDHEPAPIEFMHGRMLEMFHELRISRVGEGHRNVKINGGDFNMIIARAKTETYAKYPNQVNSNPIKKDQI